MGSYLWWDSAASAEKAGRRLIAFRPNEGAARGAIVEVLLRMGRRADAEAAIVKASKLSAAKGDFSSALDRDLIRSGRLDELEAKFLSTLRSAQPDPQSEIPWLLTIGLRNQGRLREAQSLAGPHIIPGTRMRLPGQPDKLSLGIIAFERGQPREAARWFLEGVVADHESTAPVGLKSRFLAWHMTLAATALAAAGDTAAVRALADSVERVGSTSSLGRDYKLHHFLHGLLLQHQHRHAEAVETFRSALYSLTDGYTRINLEMARSLMELQRYGEAIAILQPALRGGVDGSNTYVTHTELHFAIAHAFELSGQRDSAATHYAAVERRWRHADPEFADRYAEAKAKARPGK
jgi:tetratricopeptide (TPR) repeat protein